MPTRGVEEVAIREGEEVEGHVRGRCLDGQATHARFGGVDALQQGVEVQPAVVG